MRLVMRPVGTGGLIWLVATACGETSSSSDPVMPSTSADDTANSTGSMGTGPATATGAGSVGSTASMGAGTIGTGGTSSADCPDIEPPLGAGCADEGRSCVFTNCVTPDFRNDHMLTCVQGAWTLADEVECQSNCPDTARVMGSPCDAQVTPGPCPISDGCRTSYLYCTDSGWSVQPSGAAPEGAGGSTNLVAGVCPNPPPMLGNACCVGHDPAVCDYSSGQGLPGVGGSDAGATGAQGGAGDVSTTGGTGGTGRDGFVDVSATGAGGASGGVGGSMGATGGTGAFAACVTCDPVTAQWRPSSACH